MFGETKMREEIEKFAQTITFNTQAADLIGIPETVEEMNYLIGIVKERRIKGYEVARGV